MSNNDIIRAWKDTEYRGSLSIEQLSQVPENPAEEVTNLPEAELNAISGGIGPGWVPTLTDDCPNSVFVCC